MANRIAGATGRAVKAVAADLNNTADLKTVETMLGTEPGITMLVNNAGVGALEPLLQSDVNVMEEMIKLNVTALMRLTCAVVPAFVSRGGGTIINISSAVAIAPELLNGVYGGTKAFVLAFSQSLHKELADKNIRIQVVLPGDRNQFLGRGRRFRRKLPPQIVMQSDDLVDAALVGFDQGEFVTIPSLPNALDWDAYELAARSSYQTCHSIVYQVATSSMRRPSAAKPIGGKWHPGRMTFKQRLLT